MKIIKFFISLVFFILMLGTFSTAMAQNGSNKKTDETKKTKKDTVKQEISAWLLSEDFTNMRKVEMDTSLVGYQEYYPECKSNIMVQNLGNPASSYQSLSFFERPELEDWHFMFSRNHWVYGMTPDRQRFYNTTTPFTILDYGQKFSNSKEETRIRALHTQNVNHFFNAGIDFNQLKSDGQYFRQEDKVYYFNVFGSYVSDRYEAYLIFSSNHYSQQENGGLATPDDILNPDLKPDNMGVRMDGAKTSLWSTNALLTQKYKLGKWVKVKKEDGIYEKFVPKYTLFYTLEYAKDNKKFQEENPIPYISVGSSNQREYYYGNELPYLSQDSTYDKIKQLKVTNMFHISSLESEDHKYSFGKRAYIGFDNYSIKMPNDNGIPFPGGTYYPLANLSKKGLFNLFVGGDIYRSKGRIWNWRLDGRYYLAGYRSQDFSVRGNMSKLFITKRDTSKLELSAKMSLTTPDYFKNHYVSNHYIWDNDFKKEYEIRVGAKYAKPEWKLELGGNVSLLTNMVYFGEKIVPEQTSAVSVFSVFVNKDFNLGPFYLQNWAVWQQSTSDVLNLPSFVYKQSFYYDLLVAKVLTLDLGWDFRYSTKYYADAYSPATTQFYTQNEEKVQGHPYWDIFIRAKLKRVRFYTKFSHINQMWTTKSYIVTPNYAEQASNLVFGLSWSFYD